MLDRETRNVLSSVLQVVKEQALYLDRQQRWLIALAEAMEKQPDLVAHLKQHPFYDQAHRQDVHKIESLLQNIDALIQQLRD
jgi:hypothetical protein